MQKIVHNSCHSTLPIECVHDGHVGGPKQYNDFPLGNISFYANIFYCFSPLTWHTLYTYDRRRILKHVLKSYDIFCDAHDSRKRVIGLILKADLDGTTFAYHCRMRLLERTLLASCKKSHTTLFIQHCLYLRLS